ncbi:methyl-accepting chemotaxis protein [Burkholderia contaminans]|uniref:methyl-accepting chemotaxis protein n=1 Tax=Burkholderia contaminans TaxID=488447 RepID=UPI001CF2A1B7|nr:methyl-accepting chemotaxis protein [Burkholderia contaminans]MCA8098757.1 methyl-accepting chemotaxis protein [Burkholderia contaminans]
MNKLTGSIKFKIVVAFAACVVVMIAIGLEGIRGLATLSSDMSSMYTDSTVPIEDLAGTQAGALQMRINLERLVTTHDAAETKTIAERVRVREKKMLAAWNDYYPAKVTAADERKVADRIAGQLGDFRALASSALGAAESGNADATAAALDKLRPLGSTLADGIDEDIAINAKQVKEAADQGNDTFHLLLWASLGTLAIGMSVATGAWRYLQRAITQPLGIAMNTAQRIADGHLENKIETRSNDEFGRLLDALRQMDTQLARVVRGIKTSSDSILTASSEIAAGNMDLSSRTEEQAASLEETAASMEELTATVKQNSENARQATTLATNASDVADTGSEVVERMLSTMHDITASSTKIADITGLIESIAFQTNILALNAAVEAARAGEQGRGFAVVAGEVRSLAQRASSAAKEIKDLIHQSVETVRDGSEQAEAVGRTMADVRQAIRRVADINAEISAASDEQSRGIEQVNVAVGQMDEVTQQNAALVEQASAAAQSLEQQAAEQKRAVAVFKLAGDPAAATAAPASTHGTPKVARRPAPARVAAPRAMAALAGASGRDDWETF